MEDKGSVHYLIDGNNWRKVFETGMKLASLLENEGFEDIQIETVYIANNKHGKPLKEFTGQAIQFNEKDRQPLYLHFHVYNDDQDDWIKTADEAFKIAREWRAEGFPRIRVQEVFVYLNDDLETYEEDGNMIFSHGKFPSCGKDNPFGRCFKKGTADLF